jgi:hypothetical protein
LAEDTLNDTASFIAPHPGYETVINLNRQVYWVTNSLNLWQGAGGRVTISNGMLKVKSVSIAPQPVGTTTNVYLTVRNAAVEAESAVFGAVCAVFDSGSLWVSNRFSVGSVGRGWATVRLEGGAAVSATNEFLVAYDTGSTGTVVNAGGMLREPLIINFSNGRQDSETTLV